MGDDIGATVSPTTITMLRIEWTNPEHELLSKDEMPSSSNSSPVVHVVVEPIPADKDGMKIEFSTPHPDVVKGHAEFPIAPIWSKVRITLTFAPRFAMPSFSEDHAAGTRTRTTNPLNIVQSTVFRVQTVLARGGSSGPKLRPDTDKGVELEHRLYHPDTELTNPDVRFMDWPRYSMKSLEGFPQSFTTLLVRPELVDVTALWRRFALFTSKFDAHARLQQNTGDYPTGDVWNSLRILALTKKGRSNLLAVFIPTAARQAAENPETKVRPPLKALNTFVMLTPSKYKPYNSITFRQGPTQEQFNKKSKNKEDRLLGDLPHNHFIWSRYLLDGRRDSTWDNFKDYYSFLEEENPATREIEQEENTSIPVGFSAAIERSKKSMVLILPLAQGDSVYPDWVTKHDALLAQILKLLWKNKHIALGEAEPPDVGRQGLGGFSRSGERLLTAVTNNPAVSVICSFDAQGATATPQVKFTESFPVSQWLSNGETRVFCLTGGLAFYTAADVNSVADNLKSFSKRVFAHPQHSGFWGPYFWPDPTAPKPTPPDDDKASDPAQVGSWWVRLIRPSRPPTRDPFSMNDHDKLVAGLFIVPEPPQGTLVSPRPVTYTRALALLGGEQGAPPATVNAIHDLAHQFAIAGGGALTDPDGKPLTDPDGKPVEMSYLQCIFTHWARF